MANQIITAIIGADTREFDRAMDSLQSSMEGIQGSFKSLSDGLSPISASLGALGGAGVLASENIENAFKQFQTKLGATGSDLSTYKGELEQLASTGVGSFDEMASSMVSVKQNMKGLSNGELDKMTEQAMQVADVMGADVGEVTRSAGMLMQQFGVDGQTAMDMIAKGQQLGLDKGGELLDSINEYSVQFKDMGFTGEEMFNMLATGMENGSFSLDKLGDGIKEFNLRAGDGSKSTADAFSALGLDAVAMGDAFNEGGQASQDAFVKTIGELGKIEDATKRNDTAVALFGSTYEDLQSGLITASKGGQDAMGDFGGTAEQLAKDNESFGQQMAGVWNQIQIAIKPVGDALKNAITAVMPVVVSAVQSLSTAFQNLSPTGQNVVLAIGGITAVLPLLLTGLAGITGIAGLAVQGFTSILSVTKLFGTGLLNLGKTFMTIGKLFLNLSKLFLTNPFMLIATAIVVAGVLIYQNWDAISSWLTSAWGWIKDTAVSVWDGITAFFKKWGSTIIAVITGPIGILSLLIYKNWDSIKSFLVGLWGSIKSVASSVWNGIKSTISNVVTGMKDTITSVWNGIKSTTSSVFNGIKSTATSVWNGIKTAITKPVNAAKDAVKTAIDKIKGFFTGLKLKFPKIEMPKMPKFSLKGDFSLSPPSVPKVGISWHEKGGVIGGSAGGQVVGVGENHGTEAILPLSKRSKFKPFANALAGMIGTNEGSGNGGTTVNYNFHVNGLTVREEADVQKIAKELHRQTETRNRAGGLVGY